MIPLVGLPPRNRPPHRRHRRGDPARAARRRARPPVRRPSTESTGSHPGEGVFLPCSFWLADNLCLIGPIGRGHRALRAPDRARQRRRADRRGVRPDLEADARELPPGVHPRVAGQRRVQLRPRHRSGVPPRRRRQKPPRIDPFAAGGGAPTRVAAPPVSSCRWSRGGRVRDARLPVAHAVRPRSSRVPTTPGTTPSRARSRTATSGGCPRWAAVACSRSASRPPTPFVLAVGRSLLFWVNSFDAHLWTGAALGALAAGAVAALAWRLGRRAPRASARADDDRRGAPVRAEPGRGRCIGLADVRGPGAPDRRVRAARHRPVGHR